MKKLFLILILALSGISLRAQVAFTDADSIGRNYVDSIGKFHTSEAQLTVVANMLNRHLDKPQRNIQSVFAEYSNNPFIGPMIPLGNQFNESAITSANRFSLPQISGVNVPMIADGLAKFLVERFKEEMVYTFLDNFKEMLTKHPEFGVIFPNTVQMLQGIESFKVKEILPALRDEFKEDISTLYQRIPQLLETGVFAEALNGHQGYKNLVLQGLKIAGQIAHGAHFSTVLKDFATYPQVTDEDSSLINPSATLRLIGTLSESFRTNETGNVWVDGDKILSGIENKYVMQLYMGLLYEHVKNVKVLTKEKQVVTLGSIMKSDSLTLQKVRVTALYFSQTLNEVDQLVQDIIANKDQPQTADLYLDYMDKSISIVRNNYQVINLFCGDCVDTKKTGKVLDILTNSIDIYHSVKEKKYLLAVTQLYMVVRDITDLSRPQNSRIKISPELQLVIDQMLKYGTFMANVIEAKSSDEVRDVIRAAALPPGSSVTKTYSSFSIAINGYVGGAVGHDFFNGLSKSPINSAAVWAPVGLSFNLGTNKKGIGTVGLFVPIIDIGALVSFRWDDSTTTLLPQFNARNLLAPGAYLTIGRIANTPITVSLGGQYGPQLRSINATNADISQDAWRVGMTISCDIPLFYVYRKPRRR